MAKQENDCGNSSSERYCVNVTSSPAIGADGTVYTAARDQVFALNGQTGKNCGYLKLTNLSMMASPAIGADGIVYVGSGKKEHCLCFGWTFWE